MPRKIKKVGEIVNTSEVPSVIQGGGMEVQVAASELIKSACKKIGMSLDDYLLAIKKGLLATRVRAETQWDSGGEEVDHATRLKAALMGLEVEGYIKAKGLDGGTTNNFFDVRTLVQAWSKTT